MVQFGVASRPHPKPTQGVEAVGFGVSGGGLRGESSRWAVRFLGLANLQTDRALTVRAPRAAHPEEA